MLGQYIKDYAKYKGFPEEYLAEIANASEDQGVFCLNFAGIFVSLIEKNLDEGNQVQAIISLEQVGESEAFTRINFYQRKLFSLKFIAPLGFYLESEENILSLIAKLNLDNLSQMQFNDFLDQLESLCLTLQDQKQNLNKAQKDPTLKSKLQAYLEPYFDLKLLKDNFYRFYVADKTVLLSFDLNLKAISLKTLLKARANFLELKKSLSLNDELNAKALVSCAANAIYVQSYVSLEDDFKNSLRLHFEHACAISEILKQDFKEREKDLEISSLQYQINNFLQV